MKKLSSLILSAVAALCLCLGLAACADGTSDTEDTKYDVAIRVECSDGTIYEFPVGEDEKHIEIAYDGEERTYRVTQYRLEGYSEIWLDQIYSPYTPKRFSVDILKGNDETGYEDVDNVTDQGDYLVQIRTDSPILSLVNYKKWSLYITIE